MTIADIIKGMARRHGIVEPLVGGLVLEAIEELVKAIDSGKEMKVQGLGTFHWKRVRARVVTGALKGSEIPGGWKLRFRPARRFRSRRTEMSEDGMTKYGVELDGQKTKQASEKTGEAGCCPICSRRLDDAGACPIHGTEPLEPTRNTPSRR